MTFDLAAADAAYRPFAPFEAWARVQFDLKRWREQEVALAELRGADPETRGRAYEVVRRAAAVQTGAVEGLYKADRGFTFTVALQSALMEQAMARRPEKERSLIKDQIRTYESVLDFATRRVPIAEAWIRELHAELCRSQKTYRVWTAQGWQDQVLPLGSYKNMPNHVIQPDESVHSYAPVLATPHEMSRLVREITGSEFESAHPIVQAAFAHHALVAVHPFADGNGRVARALGSVFTCRAYSIPLFIFEDSKPRYFDALSTADRGDPGPFIDFILDACIEAVRVASESFRAAKRRSIDEVSEHLGDLYRSIQAYSEQAADQAAANLKQAFHEAWENVRPILSERGISLKVTEDSGQPAGPRAGFRHGLGPSGGRLIVHIGTPTSTNPRVTLRFRVEIPLARQETDIIQLVDDRWLQVFEARIPELVPRPTSSVALRLAIAVQGLTADGLGELAKLAEASIRRREGEP